MKVSLELIYVLQAWSQVADVDSMDQVFRLRLELSVDYLGLLIPLEAN